MSEFLNNLDVLNNIINDLRKENEQLRNDLHESKKAEHQTFMDAAIINKDNDKLKELLNKGNESLIMENESLRWACAAKDAENTILRKRLGE
jgi:cell shape-determining protein MreC